VLAADHHEAVTLVAHEGLDHLHLVVGHVVGRDVAENHGVVVQQVAHRVGDAPRRDDVDLDVVRAERLRQKRRLAAVAGGVEQPRGAADDAEGVGAVVLRDGVVLRLDRQLVGEEPAAVDGDREVVDLLAGADVDRHLVDELAVADQADLGRRRHGAVQHEAHVDRLAETGAARSVQTGQHHLGAGLAAQRHDVKLDAVIARHPRLGDRAADVFVAVGDQHQPLLGVVRKGGHRQLQRLADVGEVAARGGLPLGEHPLVDARRGQELQVGVGAEVDLAQAVVFPHGSTRLFQRGLHCRQLGAVDRVRAVQRHHDADAVAEPHELHARQRADQERPDDDPHAEADPLLVRPEAGEA